MALAIERLLSSPVAPAPRSNASSPIRSEGVGVWRREVDKWRGGRCSIRLSVEIDLEPSHDFDDRHNRGEVPPVNSTADF